MTEKQTIQAQDLFKSNPNLEKLWVNPKGEFFTNESLAKNSIKEDEKLEVIARNSTTTIKDTNAKELIELAKEQTSIEELEQLKSEEIEDKNRKTVIKAFEDKIEELKVTQDNG